MTIESWLATSALLAIDEAVVMMAVSAWVGAGLREIVQKDARSFVGVQPESGGPVCERGLAPRGLAEGSAVRERPGGRTRA
jgi:hypothetical protein